MNGVNSKEDFLIFGSPMIEQEEIDEVVNCFKSGWIGTGPRVAKFESEFSSYKGVEQAVAVNSCTAALHLSLLAADLESGAEVITTPLTFCATVNAIIHSGAKPVLADINPKTMNIDPDEILRRITPRTRAIVPVHFAGRACEMDRIMEIAKRHDLVVIEDCAHAIETEFGGVKAGTFGDFGCFSFYVTKNITTGEGGMVLAKQARQLDKIKTLALHGMTKDAWKRFGDEGYKHYLVTDAGFKYNMTDVQASVGRCQLRRVDAYWKRREQIWQQYTEAFSDLPIGLPAPVQENSRHAHHLFTILVSEADTGISRDGFLNHMTAAGIGVGVHYLSIPEHPYYQHAFGWSPDDYPYAATVGRQTVSLPISAKLQERDVERIIRVVRSVFSA